jgi:hypothetical protein
MAADKAADRKAKLAQALKQNLKRRKKSELSGDMPGSSRDLGPGAGLSPQGGLRPLPPQGPKTASKRN